MEEILKVEQISQIYQADNGELTALEDISFSVGKGEFVSIVGPSGCGKIHPLVHRGWNDLADIRQSTSAGRAGRRGFLHTLAICCSGIICWSGEISIKMWVLGLEIRKKLAGGKRGICKQPVKSIWIMGVPGQISIPAFRRHEATGRLDSHIGGKAGYFPFRRSLFGSGLSDPLAVTDDVRRILKLEQKTTLMVTHDISESISMSDRIIVLSRRPAHISRIMETSICRSGTDAAAAPRAAPVSGIFQYHMERA